MTVPGLVTTALCACSHFPEDFQGLGDGCVFDSVPKSLHAFLRHVSGTAVGKAAGTTALSLSKAPCCNIACNRTAMSRYSTLTKVNLCIAMALPAPTLKTVCTVGKQSNLATLKVKFCAWVLSRWVDVLMLGQACDLDELNSPAKLLCRLFVVLLPGALKPAGMLLVLSPVTELLLLCKSQTFLHVIAGCTVASRNVLWVLGPVTEFLLMCRHVMHAHLTHLSEPSATLQSLTEQAAFFLLSTCIRSAEGRKRIVNEIVQTLSPSDKADSKSDEQAAVRRAASNPYKVQPGFPAPHKVHRHLC